MLLVGAWTMMLVLRHLQRGRSDLRIRSSLAVAFG